MVFGFHDLDIQPEFWFLHEHVCNLAKGNIQNSICSKRFFVTSKTCYYDSWVLPSLPDDHLATKTIRPTQPAFVCSKPSMETTEKCEICSKLIKTPKQRQRRRSGVFTVDFNWTLHIILKLLLFSLKSFLRLVK